MQSRKYALTQIGDQKDRRIHSRRDANCPIIVHAKKRTGDSTVAVQSWLVNLSEEGCQVASDHFPRNVHEVYVIIPGLGSKVHGNVVKQGDFTLHVAFTTALTAQIVDKVGRIKVVPRALAKPAVSSPASSAST
ncbi:hypothetical protein [Hoeflea olei]|uniref:PilZ domain-containing protein n=1 Tax=Hoeflea olei TaxID=1480615 RepID=A0A1C1YXQ3_9HYPH|nr:hypothetical protein [Hoeflea olei]OCW58190.1 hypothetical protein AWJ14_01120 [Hoeflea olei]